MSACLANGLAVVLGVILSIVKIIVFASIIVSWVGDPGNRFVQMINSMSEPMYRPFRKFTANFGGPIDWAPLLVLLLVYFLEAAGVGMLQKMGMACRSVGF